MAKKKTEKIEFTVQPLGTERPTVTEEEKQDSTVFEEESSEQIRPEQTAEEFDSEGQKVEGESEHDTFAPKSELTDVSESTDIYGDIPEDERLLLDEEEPDPLLRFEQPQPKKEKKSGQGEKKPWIMIGVAGAVAVIAIFIALIASNSNKKSRTVEQYQDEVSSIWDERVQASKDIKSSLDAVNNVSGFSGLRVVLLHERDNISTAIATLSTIQIPDQYTTNQSELVQFLIDYKDYLNNTANLIDRTTFTDMSDAAMEDLVDQGDEVGQQASVLRMGTDFIKSDIDSGVFRVLPANIESLILTEQGRLEEAQQKEEEEKQKEEEAEQQKELDKQAAQDAAEQFIQDYIDGDIQDATDLLASGVKNQYALAQGEDSQIIDYSVLSNTDKEDYYLLVIKIIREVVDPSYEPTSIPLDEAIPMISESSNEEVRVKKEGDEWKVSYVEFLE